MRTPFDLAADAAEALIGALGDRPEVAVIAGSGWAAVADELGTPSGEVSLGDLPGVPTPTVAGHSGVARLIDVAGIPTLVVAGRSHLYEGHGVDTVVHTVRAAVLAGSHTVVLTNAAGTLDLESSVGEPILISDQINLTGANPMAGPPPPQGFPSRFCDLTHLYDPDLRHAARVADPSLREGVYAGMLGGSYETPAEISMLAGMGADLVGMSTVLEAIAAAHLGARVAGVSLVTNFAAGLGPELSHDEVLDAGRSSGPRLVEVCGLLVGAAADRAEESGDRSDILGSS